MSDTTTLPGQLDLLRPLARTTDPDTSHEAAESAVESAHTDRTKALALLRVRGPMTPYEVNALCGWDYPRANRRMSELERAALIAWTGATRATPSGRQSRVMRAV